MRAPSSTSDEPPPLESGFLGPASATARVSGGIARRESPLAGKAGEPAAGGLASQLQSLTLKASLANSSGRPPAAPLAPPVAAALAPVGAPVYLSASFRDPASLPQFPVAISEGNDETGIESDEDERNPATGGALRPGGESSVSLVEAAAAAAAVMAAAGGSRAAGAPPAPSSVSAAGGSSSALRPLRPRPARWPPPHQRRSPAWRVPPRPPSTPRRPPPRLLAGAATTGASSRATLSK